MGRIEKVQGKKEYKVKLADQHYCDAPCDILIGGKDENTGGKFVPNINMIKWDDEAFLNINHPLLINTETETLEDGIIRLIWDDIIIRYYITPDGKLEYEITLNSRPAQNKITLDIDYSPGLSFFFQPPLTPEEIDGGFHRPENVVGSYAIYFNKKNNKYKTGKFCHIFRPELIDNNGDKSWADLNIDTAKKELTITMDRVWLRDATYPVIIDPYLGYNTQGASDWGAATTKRGSITSTDATGGDTTTWYACFATHQANTDTKLGLYPTSGGFIEGQTLVEQALLVNHGTGWSNVAAGGSTLSASTDYWTGFVPEHNSNDVYYDEGDTGDSSYVDGVTYADEMVATGQADTASTKHWSIYCEYGVGNLSINVSDGIGLSESIGPRENLGPASVNDTIALSEALSLIMNLGHVSVTDSFVLSELVNALVSIEPNVSDSIALGELVSALTSALQASAADTITLSELVTVIVGAFQINVSDSLNLGEFVSTLMSALQANVTDGMTLSEAVTVVLETLGDLEPDVSDTLALTEAITAQLNLAGISVLDAIHLAESLTATVSINPSVSDSLTLAESVGASIPLAPNIVDYLNLMESVLITKDITPSLVDTLNLSEYLRVLMVVVEGRVTMTLTSEKPHITFTAKKPGITFTGNKPHITFTGE